MTEEVLALVYKFLQNKDQTCAEIFKRGFNPNENCASNLPSLEEIVQFYIASKKKETSRSLRTNDTTMSSSELQSMIEIGKTKSSDFLTRIVNKRKDCVSESEEESDQVSDPESDSDDDSEEIRHSEPKRRRTSAGMQKIAGNKAINSKNGKKAKAHAKTRSTKKHCKH